MSNDPTELNVAVVQLNSSADKRADLASAERFVRRAAEAGARLIVLPEYFNCLGARATMLAEAEPLDGPTVELLGRTAAATGATIVGGTFCERTDDPRRVRNTSIVVDSSGAVAAVYRKLHLFDVDIPGQVAYCETPWIAAGDALSTFDCCGFRVAQAVCYDLRFPELFRRYAEVGVDVVVLPAAFTQATGRVHWEMLLRSRAVENQCYVAAADQCGTHDALTTYGHSLICDPWGDVLVDAGETEGFVTATVRRARIDEVRERLPALQHRRPLDALPLRIGAPRAK